MSGRLANARAITKQLLCDNLRPEAASDVISGADVERIGVNVLVKFDDSQTVLEIHDCLTFTNDDADVRRLLHQGRRFA